MYQKKKMPLRNLKKLKKHMLYYQTPKKEKNMTNSDIMPFLITVQDSLDSKALILETSQISSKIYLEEWAFLVQEEVPVELVPEEKEMMFYTI